MSLNITQESMHSSKNLSPRRIVESDKEDNPFYVERTDPYGHWFIRYKSGPTPYELQGAFTRAERAYLAIEGFLNRRQNIPEKVKKIPLPKRPS